MFTFYLMAVLRIILSRILSISFYEFVVNILILAMEKNFHALSQTRKYYLIIIKC
jgi:hypothetical protein